MPFQKGHPQFGGKQKGCKHKITREVSVLLDKLGCNPIEGLARIATTTKDHRIAAHCYGQLAKYVHPQLQSVQVTGAGGGPIEYSDTSAREQFVDRVRGLAASRATRDDPSGSDGG